MLGPELGASSARSRVGLTRRLGRIHGSPLAIFVESSGNRGSEVEELLLAFLRSVSRGSVWSGKLMRFFAFSLELLRRGKTRTFIPFSPVLPTGYATISGVVVHA